MENHYYPFKNQPLPYDFDALEPFIDAETMYLHHNRHLQTYIDNLNSILKENPNLQRLSLTQLIRSSSALPRELGMQISRNAGGVYNHRFFFDGLTPDSDREPVGMLAKTINKSFGSFDNFKEKFKKAALSVFGSGYAWLVYDRSRLKILTTANQNTPLTMGACPIITVDVWEHAYYLKHYNVRAAYIDDWVNVVDWNMAEENYLLCRKPM